MNVTQKNSETTKPFTPVEHNIPGVAPYGTVLYPVTWGRRDK